MYKTAVIPYDIIRVLPSIAIATLSCVLLLAVIDDRLDYWVFFFGLSLILLLLLHIFKYNHILRLNMPFAVSKKTVDYVAVACAAGIIILGVLGNPSPLLRTIFATIVVFFVPGWVLVRILLIGNTSLSKGAILVLAFALSSFLSGLIFMVAMFYPIILSPHILSAVYLVISLAPLIRGLSIHGNTNFQAIKEIQIEYKTSDLLLLAWLLAFFLSTIFLLYPDMARVPGLDIVRHFSEAKGLLSASDIYASSYPWYHFLLASIIALSGASMLTFQSILSSLSFILIFSFYIMARSYLSTIDYRAPILATVLFSVFAGFGWRFFLEKLPNPNDIASYGEALNLVFRATYFDIGYGEGAWMWLWFRPVTIGLIIFFVLLYLLRNEGLNKRKYILVSSFLLITLTQVHFSEFVLFVALIFILTIFVPKANLRLRETSLSVCISILAYAALIYFYPIIFKSDYMLYFEQHISTELVVGLASLGVVSFILSHNSKRPFSRLKLDLKYSHTIIVMLAILFIYLILLFHWFLNSERFVGSAFPKVLTLLSVPPQFYPMLLGFTGIFAIISIPIVIREYKRHPILIFVMMFVLMICIGRAVTVIGYEFGPTSYFERRILFHVFTAASVLAPVGILIILKHIDRGQLSSRNLHISTTVLISFIVLGGVLSTFLSVEYQMNFIKQNAVSENKIEAVQQFIGSNPYSTVLTASSLSRGIAEFSSPGYLIGHWSNQIWPSRSPELPLNILMTLNSSIVYMQGNDSQLVSNTYPNGFVNTHLLNISPTIYENMTDTAVEIPRLSPPSSSSNAVLVLADSAHDKVPYYAYDVLSFAGYNYTTAFLSDIPTISNAKIVVAPSESIAWKIMQYKKEYSLKFQKLIVLNTDGRYGNIWAYITDLSGHDVIDTGQNSTNSNRSGQDWVTSSFGSGNISRPELVDDYVHNPLTGGKATKIAIEQGNNSYWKISRDLDAQNLTGYDFVYFDWYGRGDGKWYSLYFKSETDQFFWYKFQDSSDGWNRIVLPLHVKDGRSNSFGTFFDRHTQAEPSWANITRIEFRPEARNINSGGNFFFEGFLFGQLAESSAVTLENASISNMSAKIPLASSIKLLPYSAEPNVYEISSYEDTNVPFIIKKTNSGFDMFYINMYPIISSFALDGNNSRTISLLGKFMDIVPSSNFIGYNSTDRSSITLTSGGVGAFSRALFKGDLSLSSSSATIDNTDGLVITISVDGQKAILKNVNRVIPLDIQHASVQGTDGGILEKGYGFYSTLVANQSSVLLAGKPARILIEYQSAENDANEISTVEAEKIQLDLGKSKMVLRQPEILSNGITDLRSFYAYGELYNRIPILGEDLKINGTTSFNVDYSDDFTVVNSATFDGKFMAESEANPYNEFSSLSDIFSLSYLRPMLTVLVVLAVVAIYLLDRKGIFRSSAEAKTTKNA